MEKLWRKMLREMVSSLNPENPPKLKMLQLLKEIYNEEIAPENRLSNQSSSDDDSCCTTGNMQEQEQFEGLLPHEQAQAASGVYQTEFSEASQIDNSYAAEPRVEFSTGAVRGHNGLARFDLLPYEAIKEWAEAYSEGLAKGYPLHNILKGIPNSNLLNHAIEHIYMFLDGDISENHLGHAMFNIGVAIHQKIHRPELNDLPPYSQESTAGYDDRCCQSEAGCFCEPNSETPVLDSINIKEGDIITVGDPLFKGDYLKVNSVGLDGTFEFETTDGSTYGRGIVKDVVSIVDPSSDFSFSMPESNGQPKSVDDSVSMPALVNHDENQQLVQFGNRNDRTKPNIKRLAECTRVVIVPYYKFSELRSKRPVATRLLIGENAISISDIERSAKSWAESIFRSDILIGVYRSPKVTDRDIDNAINIIRRAFSNRDDTIISTHW